MPIKMRHLASVSECSGYSAGKGLNFLVMIIFFCEVMYANIVPNILLHGIYYTSNYSWIVVRNSIQKGDA